MLGRLALLLFVVAPLATSAYALDVSACGTVIPPGETGVLVTDLVCSPTDSGIQMNDRSTLDLNGHTITGGLFGVTGSVSLRGRTYSTYDRCRILSSKPGGAIVGSKFGITNCGKTAVSNVEVVGTTLQAVGGGRVDLTDVTLRDGAAPLTVGSLTARNLTITNNHDVSAVRRASIRGLTATANQGELVLHARSMALKDATITGNTGVGIIASRLTLVRSTVTGNDTAGTGVDLVTSRAPHPVDSTCGRSEQFGLPGSSWQVCTGDPP
jgi:hypothetical protein